ncbi:hypothetical protein HNR46_003411 [Haloferula luteola]|uniref:Uncharacterized protein n=1 Tax=Haloferula luteola TaxID=595692 RepID=A0A840V4E2_9BACT|nr:hypothetical protein [Haloferula luteola]MBB5353157.1 hypothetical protein [Haloferula luteola]
MKDSFERQLAEWVPRGLPAEMKQAVLPPVLPALVFSKSGWLALGFSWSATVALILTTPSEPAPDLMAPSGLVLPAQRFDREWLLNITSPEPFFP